MTRSRRFVLLEGRDINKETFVEPWPEAGLIVTDSPYDPQPSLQLNDECSQITILDGKPRVEFDALDTFIADHAIDLSVAEEAMATPSSSIAHMLADINIAAARIRRLGR